MVRVLVVMPFPALQGGSERLLLALLERPQDHGTDLRLAVLEDGPFAAAARALGVATDILGVSRPNDPRQAVAAVRALRALIRRDRPDVVLSWWARAQLYAAPAALSVRPRPRIAWWQHDVDLSHPIQRLATVLPADRVVCTSHAAADAQAALRPRRRTTVVRPGVVVVPPADRDAARAALGARPGELLVGIAGRLVRWKGQDRLLEAAAAMRAAGRPVRAVVIGGTTHGLEPDYAEEIAARAARPDLAGHVTLTGHLDAPLEAIGALDVLVNASAAEPFGMTLVEAMGLGVPVVAVDAAGPREIVRGTGAGVLARDGSPEALAAAIAEVLDGDPQARSAMAAAARHAYEDRFTATRYAYEAGDVLRSIAAA